MNKSTLKKFLSVALCLLILVTSAVSVFAYDFVAEDTSSALNGATQNQLNIVARADYMYGLTWYCHETITAHAYSSYYTYYAGNTYRMPYGQGATSYYIGYGVSTEDFVKAANDPNSIFYSQKSYVSSWYSAYYIQDCSGFVSWCWGLAAKQSTRSLSYYSDYIASINTNNINNYLQIGDALNRYDYHVVLVTDIERDSYGNITMVEITEQTIPQTKRTYYYSASALASEYSSYDGIYRYDGSDGAVPSAPAGAVTTTNKLEDNAHVDMGKDFYARIKHPSSGNYLADVNRYVNATDFSDGSEQVWHFMRQASGAYLIGNSSTGKFIEVEGASYKDATRLVTNSANFESNQKFFIYYIDNNFYFMPEGGDKTLDINASTLEGQIYGSTTGREDSTGVASAARQFNLEILSIHDGTKEISDLGESFTATIKNPALGKYITASNGSLIGANESKVENQQWQFTRLPNGAYSIISVSEGLSFDVYERLLTDKTAIDLYEYHGEYNQAFFIIESDGKYYIKLTYTMGAVHMDSSSFEIYSQTTSDDASAIASQKFEIIPFGTETELVLKKDSSYSKDVPYLLDVSMNHTPSTLLSNFENTMAVVVDSSGTPVQDSAKVATGFKVNLVVNGDTIDSLTVVVSGDVDGNGNIDSTDYLRIKSVFLDLYTLEGEYFLAADMDKSNSIDSTDYLKIKSIFLGLD